MRLFWAICASLAIHGALFFLFSDGTQKKLHAETGEVIRVKLQTLSQTSQPSAPADSPTLPALPAEAASPSAPPAEEEPVRTVSIPEPPKPMPTPPEKMEQIPKPDNPAPKPVPKPVPKKSAEPKREALPDTPKTPKTPATPKNLDQRDQPDNPRDLEERQNIPAPHGAAGNATQADAPNAAKPMADASGSLPAVTGGVVDVANLRVTKKVGAEYPAISRKRRDQGTVTLLVRVESGRVVSASVERGSGHKPLDEAALRAVRGWQFDTMGYGEGLTVRIPFAFTLR